MPCSSALIRKYLYFEFGNMSLDRSVFETGTETGHGIVAALAAGAKRVYSVDVNKQDQDWLRPRMFYGVPEVELYTADSPAWLADMATSHAQEFQRGLLWLDAHSAKDTAILRELDVLKCMKDFRGVVMLDDMRIFRTGNEWATKVREPDVLSAFAQLPGTWDATYEPDTFDDRDIYVTWRVDE